MSQAKITAGIICSALGVLILAISIVAGIALIIIGATLIIFNKDEETVEQRKDISLNKKKTKI